MESESQAGDDAFSFAQAEQRFLALHRSTVRNHKMLRLGELRQRFTDPIETKAFTETVVEREAVALMALTLAKAHGLALAERIEART